MSEKQGVFISHITEESATALLLKDFLQRAFSKDLPVFVSSDYESITGGDTWFTKIVAGVKNCAVIIVILSPDSLARPWINFEAGVGIGADTTVIPVVAHGLERSAVGQPLTSPHIRSLQTVADVYAVMNDIAEKIGVVPKAMNNANALVSTASEPTPGSGWMGVEWQGSFLAVAGPVFKLRKIDDQVHVDTIDEALKKGGYIPRLANRNYMGPTISAGYTVVHLTDKKTYYADITSYDAILTAKLGGPSAR